MNPLSLFYTVRSYVDAYAGFIGRRFLSLLWVVALGFAIWFYGPLLRLGSLRPLESPTNRLIAIGVVVALWLVYLLVSFIRSRRRDEALVEGIEQDAETLAKGARSAEVEEVRGQLRDALKLLKRVTRKRFGYVYELPWYVIFGAPGSGKTTAITYSGLTFPLGVAEGEEHRGVAGTRSCNWWFGEEAILVDTAGRYTTQDDLSGAAKAGWNGFLALLRKFRRSQPVNGAIVTLSIADLLERSPEERLDEVRAIRKRLNELDEVLRARVPVYVVLTKTDLLTGFIEFFDGLNRNDREQVWGMTFDLEVSERATDLPDRYLDEFSALQERIGAMLIERLQQERDATVRGRIFRFPAELSALRDTVHEIVVELSSGSKLIKAPLVRGVYFASSTQAADATTGSVARTIPRMRRSYFLSRLFKDVIIGEAALVSRDRRLTSHVRTVRGVAYGAALCLVVLALTGWTLVYLRNDTALAAAAERIDAYEEALAGIPTRDVADADFLRILPALDNLGTIDDDFIVARSWPIALGLDQGPKIEARQDAAYQRALNALLLPRLLVHLQTVMAESNDPIVLFDALKLYGMLGGLGELDADYAEEEARRMFDDLYPGDGRTAVRDALTSHVRALGTGTVAPLAVDATLVADVRSKIGGIGYGERAFAILASDPIARGVPPFVPADALGPVGERAFERRSTASLRDGVEGLYTADGYRAVVGPLIDRAAGEALTEDWVRGPSPSRSETVDGVAAAALALYLDEFTRRWSGLLGDIRPRPGATLAEQTETARLLASDPGPMEALAVAIAAATDLQSPIPGAGTLEGAGSLTSTVTDVATVDLTSIPDPYAPLRAALAPPDGAAEDASAAGAEGTPSEIAALGPLLDTIYQQLSRASTSTAAVAEVFNASGELTKANEDLLQTARRLPEPVATWLATFAADIAALGVETARTTSRDSWPSAGGELCVAAVTGRYPFDRASPDDVSLADFTRLFGPTGVFSTFFDERLEPFVDTTASPWTWRGALRTDGGVATQALASFERAAAIRRAFFPPGSEEPSVTINVEPVSLTNANAVQLEIEDERVVYYQGPKIGKSIDWPSAESTNRARIAFQPGDISRATTRGGDWSAFRLFDEATIESSRNDLMRVRFEEDGRSATFDVQFGSVLNPFELPALTAFQCPTTF